MWDRRNRTQHYTKRSDLCGRNWSRADQRPSTTRLCWTETGYSSHPCTLDLAWWSSSPKLCYVCLGLSKILTAFESLGCNATQAYNCTAYSHIWIGFLRIWDQWAASRGRHWVDGDQVTGTGRCSHDGRLLLDFEETSLPVRRSNKYKLQPGMINDD